MKKRHWIIPLAGIAAIAVIEVTAIKADINGAYLALSMGAIGAIVTGGTIKIRELLRKNGAD